MVPEKLYLSVDRQEHLVNWTNRKDKRQTVFQAIGTADNATSYVLGIHLNYDPGWDWEVVEERVKACKDYEAQPPFRRFARFWLQGDYHPAITLRALEEEKTEHLQGNIGLRGEILKTYEHALARQDVEASDLPAEYTKLPLRGLQVHAEYTLYGHFFFLSELLSHVPKIRFFLDQESGIRAACLAAFVDKVLDRTCDAFYVSINKGMTNDQKQKAMREVRNQINYLMEEYPYDLSETSLRRILIERALQKRAPTGPWRDMWVEVPSRIKSEPEKQVCHLTDFGDYEEDHLAKLFDKASLHGIDRFFAQVRNSISLLARAPSSSSNTGRKWFQKNPYNPEIAAMLLDIYRVNYNYLEVGADKNTPAMRLGLAKSKIRLGDIVNFSNNTSNGGRGSKCSPRKC